MQTFFFEYVGSTPNVDSDFLHQDDRIVKDVGTSV